MSRSKGPYPYPAAIAGVNAAASATTYALLLQIPDDHGKGWLSILAVIATVTNLGTGLYMLLRSHAVRSAGTRGKPSVVRIRTALSPPNERHYFTARNRGLDLLVENHRVRLDETQLKRLRSTPLGCWFRFDQN